MTPEAEAKILRDLERELRSPAKALRGVRSIVSIAGGSETQRAQKPVKYLAFLKQMIVSRPGLPRSHPTVS